MSELEPTQFLSTLGCVQPLCPPPPPRLFLVSSLCPPATASSDQWKSEGRWWSSFDFFVVVLNWTVSGRALCCCVLTILGHKLHLSGGVVVVMATKDKLQNFHSASKTNFKICSNEKIFFLTRFNDIFFLKKCRLVSVYFDIWLCWKR